MGQGLGKNSPVVLTLGRENYEALLNRHGQWTRWRQANRCSCVLPTTQHPDIHCKRCGGRGYVYTYQKYKIVQCVVMAKDTSGILELESEYENDELIKVYDRNNNIFEADKNGIFVTLEDIHKFVKGSYYNIVLKRNTLSVKKDVEAIREDTYFVIDDISVTKANIDGIYYSAPCDLVSVGNITDSLGYEFEVDEFRLNRLTVKEKFIVAKNERTGEEKQVKINPTSPLIIDKVEYIEPSIFAVLNQNLSKADFDSMVEAQGDAVVTYPYNCDVAEGDALTVLAGSIIQKDLQAKTGSRTEPLPAFFVEDIISILTPNGSELKKGVDYVLSGKNYIKWITNCLDIGDCYSVTYKVYPTYTVTRNIPQLRTSENQRFPKKAIVKYMSSYSEQRKVNVNSFQIK